MRTHKFGHVTLTVPLIGQTMSKFKQTLFI